MGRGLTKIICVFGIKYSFFTHKTKEDEDFAEGAPKSNNFFDFIHKGMARVAQENGVC